MSATKMYSASYQRAADARPAPLNANNAANEITRAIRHPDNFEPILVCTVVFIVVGILMMVAGGVICLIYYTEITPPNFDSNYHRYVGSSMPRIVGPLLVAFGGLLSAGDLVVIGLTVQQYHKKRRPPPVSSASSGARREMPMQPLQQQLQQQQQQQQQRQQRDTSVKSMAV